jgi:DNA-binding LacI/PurR family transcriptional regulator
MPRRVTIKDVAKDADVSFKTVSNVLNGTGSMRPATRERVLASIQKLGYCVNLSARSLKTGESKLIGLAVFDFLQPFAPYLADKVIDIARERQYGVIVSTYRSGGAGIPSIIEETHRLGADGWIFFSDIALANKAEILNQPYPVVLAADYMSYGKADLVTMANIEAMEQTVGRLLDSGCGSVALVGAPMDRDWGRVLSSDEGTQELRVQGYVKAFRKRGLEVDWSQVISSFPLNSPDGVRVARMMLESGKCPDAMVCLDDALAFGVMRELQAQGKRIPEDVQVVGFDNVPEGEFSTPTLTTIDPHIEMYARKAVDMLIDRLEGYDGPARTYTSDFALVERGSTRL